MSTTLADGTVAAIPPWTLNQTGPAWDIWLPPSWDLTGIAASAVGMSIYSDVALPNSGGYTPLKTSAGSAQIVNALPAVIAFLPATSDVTVAGQYYVKFFATLASGELYETVYANWVVTA